MERVMTEAHQASPLTLLTWIVDELRETTGLLRAPEAAKDVRRPGWRSAFFGAVRSASEVSGGQSIQFLGENIDRARDHWRTVVGFLDRLWVADVDSPTIARLRADLQAAGANEILPRLAHDAIPSGASQASTYLAAISPSRSVAALS
jgi:hypothetical protein